MRTRQEIIEAIKNEDRRQLVYMHPTLTPELASRFISAFANSNGGDIVLGIEDDSKTLTYKNCIPFQMEKAIKYLNIEVNLKYEFFEYQGHRLFHISIEKSEKLVKSKEIPFFINLNGGLVEMTIKTIFLSYCHADSDLANVIEKKIGKYEDVSMSRDIKITNYRDDLDKFMRTIRDHDFVISIVTSKYLKSVNCMYEITQLMKDNNFQDRLLFIVVDSEDVVYYNDQNKYDSFEAGIYDYNKRLSYIKHLTEKNNDMKKNLDNAKLPFELMSEFTLEIRKLGSILPSASEFMDLLTKKVGKSFKSLDENGFEEFLDIIRSSKK